MILITGSSGQVGSYLIEEIPNSIGIDKRPSQHTQLIWDLRKYPHVLEGYDIEKIVHCAAQVSVEKSVKKPVFDAKNNILSTLNLLEYARKHDIEKFVYISSAAVYGDPQYVPIDESHPLNPKSPYGLSKLVGEQYTRLFHELYGIKYAIIRPFNIFSERQDPKNPYSGVITKFIDRAKKGLPLIIYGDGKQTRDFVHVSDVVQLTKLLLNSKNEGVYNCGTGKETSLLELVRIIESMIGKEIKVVYKPKRQGDILRSYANIEKARKIGFVPKTNLKRDLRRLI